jgi:hypothetical protein
VRGLNRTRIAQVSALLALGLMAALYVMFGDGQGMCPALCFDEPMA